MPNLPRSRCAFREFFFRASFSCAFENLPLRAAELMRFQMFPSYASVPLRHSEGCDSVSPSGFEVVYRKEKGEGRRRALFIQLATSAEVLPPGWGMAYIRPVGDDDNDCRLIWERLYRMSKRRSASRRRRRRRRRRLPLDLGSVWYSFSNPIKGRKKEH